VNPRQGILIMPLFLAALATQAGAAAKAPPGSAAGADDRPFWTGHPNAATFARINDQRLEGAKANIARMLAAPGKRTVENTLRPYDDALLLLDAAGSQASLIENVHPDSNLRTTAEEVSRKVAAYGTELSLNRQVYDALAAVDAKGADRETRFYLEKELRDFKLAGVDKDEATRTRIKELRDELVKIGQEFDRNIRGDTREVKADPAELAGLPQDYIDSHKPGADGKVTINTTYPDYIPVMSYAKSDALRRRLYMEYQNRAHPQNLEVLNRLIAKRHELAGLLGYREWADYITANKMSGSARTVREFIDRIAEVSGTKAQQEYQVLLARKRKDEPAATVVNFWEQPYWFDMVKRTDYDFDAQSVRPYLAYDRVKQGVLDVTGRLFGVTFRQVKDAPVWHPSVECWEMLEDGKLAGRFYLDMHPRDDKYNHAAQFDVRTGVAGRQIPEAALICNFPGGKEGDPGLMEHGDVQTFFHEFGHLLHTLFAGRHAWLGIGGIRTEHDFVEAPSQMLEEWTWDPATLATFARHHQTNQPIPAALVTQMKRASEYGKGLTIRRQVVYADLSLSIYDREPGKVNTTAMMKELVEKYQPFPFVDGTHFEAAFGHLDGYSAVYYTYQWSLVIAKDMFSQFDRSDLLAPAVAKKYRDIVLAPGGSKPAADLVADFLGRPFNFQAYQAWLNEDQGVAGAAASGKTSAK
jgi:Zn-dependent oligopeptidase